MFSIGIIMLLYSFIIFPISSLIVFFRRLKYTLDDYYDDMNTLINLEKYPPNRRNDKIYQILRKHWESYHLRHIDELRDVEIEEVEKMLNCREQFFIFKCAICNALKILYSSCNSRVCTCCGKKHVDRWSKQLCKIMYKKVHRHIVLTMPDKLWHYFDENHDLYKLLMDSTREAFNYILKETKHEDITPAYLVVLHTYSRDMGHNPHLHLIFAEGGFNASKKWVDINHIEYKLIRKAWQEAVLDMMKDKLAPYYLEIPSLVDACFKIYPEGFYIYAKDRIESKYITAKYIGRYIRHPAIASSRIVSFDDKQVTFWYEHYDTKEKIYKTMAIDDFITALIGHIPDRQFKVIRYYGAYSRAKSKVFRRIITVAESIAQKTQKKLSTFGFIPERKAPKCDKCQLPMICVWYSGKGPPQKVKYGEKITDWISALGSY